MPTPHAIMTGPGTLAHHLHRNADGMPDKVAFTFLADGEDIESELTFGELRDRAQIIARQLIRLGLTGEAVVLFHPPGREFIVAFCACLMAGVVAVPLQPPTTRRLLERARAVFDDCSASAVLTTAAGVAGVESLVAARGLHLIATDAPMAAGEDDSRPVVIQPTAAAVLQYTSGSTGSPKGVVITHGNLVSNSALIGEAFATRPTDVGVNWLPLLHDMGLIGNVVHVIHQGITCVHMSPQAMIRKPVRWLRAIARFRATISGGPDFAWRLLTERIAAEDLAGLDLSRWRVAFSGAEQVRPSTLERVAGLLAPAGFAREALLPCYGMAEATLIVSGGPPGGATRLSRPDGGDPDAMAQVACGQPLPAGSVAIVDPVAHSRRPDGQVGEVWVSGAHVAAGYWGRDEQSELTFRAHLPCDPRHWLRTGDLGYLRDGQLYISGRLKDLLIVNGRKHHPEDLEATVQTTVPGCAAGIAAAFQAEADGQAHLVIAVEMAERHEDRTAHTRLIDEIRAAVWSHHEVVVDAVAVVRLGRLPRTTSGKVRRGETRDLWAAGGLANGGGHV
ncbi:MAG: fatty acyl-AMP ligase [Planctomycetes bacterium]|nr:fatty acyl-AMP ligase [Planctomycetota bacterium]